MNKSAGLNDRQRQIMELVERDGEIRLAGLKEHFGVTEMTLRRDLEKLESIGMVKRTFGGAISTHQMRDITLDERSGVMIQEKSRIGKLAASLIRPGESVFIDGGSTTLEIVRALPRDIDVHVVTNAVNLASELLVKGVRTIMVGGILVEATSSTVGPMATEAVGKLAFDRAFLGASGLSALNGFSNSNLYEAELKRLIIERSADTTIVLDHTKFGSQVLFSFADLWQINRLISDQAPTGELLEACINAGLEWMIAE